MCVFLSIRADKAKIEKRFDASYVEEEFFAPRYFQSAYEFPKWSVITTEEPDRIHQFHWGLVPAWIKDEEKASQIRSSTVNARAETMYDKPSFRKAANSQHCLILADGFYEFQDVKGKKYPYFIQLKGQELFAIAGLFDRWINPETGEILSSFSVITTEANPLMARIHNRKKRMPAILHEIDESRWLHPGKTKDQLVPFPEDSMEAWTVGRILTTRGSSKEDPNAVANVHYPELSRERGLFD
jgi:putative SOS response-associated peptidase YedK